MAEKNTADHETDGQSKINYIEQFKNADYAIFKREFDIIKPAENDQTAADKTGKEKKIIPSTDHELVGLALSGGGIRSATFNLGFMQSLCRVGMFKKIDYLSTVSGGGYIGCCLTSLLNSDFGPGPPPDLLECENFPFSLSQPNTPPTDTPDTPPTMIGFRPGKEKAPGRYLRYYSNYLTASGKFVDRYFRPAIVILRGMVLNFCLVLPYILMAGLLLTGYFKISTMVNDSGSNPLLFNPLVHEKKLTAHLKAKLELKNYVLDNSSNFGKTPYAERLEILSTASAHKENILKFNENIRQRKEDQDRSALPVWLPPLVFFLSIVLVNLLLLRSSFSSGTYRNRFKFSRMLSYCFFVIFLLLAVNVFGLATAYWGYWELRPQFSLVAVLSFLAPFLIPDQQKDYSNTKTPWGKLIGSLVLFSLAPLFLLFLTGTVVRYLLPAELKFLSVALYSTFIFWQINELFININTISLHNFYRDRLSRAYLIQQLEKAPPFFKSVIHNDNQLLHKLKKIRPYHLINTSLNLTKKLPADHDDKSAGQEGVLRSGESFVFSREWCGSEMTGYVPTEDYENADSHLNLGTAMAISGAAFNIGMANNNMPIFRLLMGLFNVRLGYWAKRPRECLSEQCRKKKPGSWTTIREWLGDYSLRKDFVNLSDGGQFENIGIYELLRRRCKYIIAGDAEADPQMSFQALSYIIRLARIDFGINIDIDVSEIFPDAGTGLSRNHCAVGHIQYPAADGLKEESGYILYCKASLTGDETQHLREYKTKHPDFPHQTTADQWFDEQQFEAYRELGYHIGTETFKPVEQKCQLPGKEEEVFIALKEFWHPHSIAITEHFTKHSQELNAIIIEIKNSTGLDFLDYQMFPEWEELMAGVAKKPVHNQWLPECPTSIRKGFYICNLMIKLMENVYLDLDLENNYQHPDNRGWMNLFRHWSWAAFFRVTWSISACTFGSRFQRFCEKRLSLDLGELAIDEYSGTTADDLTIFLNDYERLLVEKIINEQKTTVTGLYRFHLVVKNILNDTQQIKFSFGFALMHENDIVYFRIQDHLRGMGLGRTALHGLLSRPTDLPGLASTTVKISESNQNSFLKMYTSVKAGMTAEEKKGTHP